MNRFRLAALPALVIIGLSISAHAFHAGGTGECHGCHAMHDMRGGQQGAVNDGNSSRSPFLLKGPDPSSTCLTCHASPGGTNQPAAHYVATNDGDMPPGTPPLQLTPGGDFGWLKKKYTWGQGTARAGDSPGERHGHNIIAASYGYMADPKNTVAPQGAYPADQLSCVSCHDPHGRYRRLADGSIRTSGLPVFASGSYSQSPNPDSMGAVGVYRLLGGKGYQPKYLSGGQVFTADPPAAVAPSEYNREESTLNTRVAYGKGMSEWCENCHSTSHQDNSSGAKHPAGNLKKLSAAVINNYNSYVASGNVSGNGSTAYTSVVPFELGTDDYAILRTTANSDGSDRTGPSSGKGSPNVSCLSCHRAHASGWDNMARWNIKSEFLVYKGVYPGTDNGSPPEYAQGRSAAEVQKALYGRPTNRFASYQRSLCNKCHGKD